MSDSKDKIMNILNEPQLAVLATVCEDGKPWCRYVLVFTDENMNIRFATNIATRKVSQTEKNPEVHLTCGVTNPFEVQSWLQIQGRAHTDTSEETKKDFWYDMLDHIFSGPDDPSYAVMEVKPYRIEYIEAGKLEPEVWEA